MIAPPGCRNITTEPPPARPALRLRAWPGGRPHRQRTAPSLRLRQTLVRGGAGSVAGMLVGCLTGLFLGAASGFLVLAGLFVSDTSWSSGTELIGLLCLSGIFLTAIALLLGAAVGALPGLLIGGLAGAVAATLRNGAAGRIAGMLLGASLSPLLLSGGPWESAALSVIASVSGAIGGYRVAAVAGEETRHLT